VKKETPTADSRLKLIAAFPEFWGSVGAGYRRKLLERYPYGIIYRIEGEEILIIALAHTSRRPAYWRGR
jgi:plasmid stabilization system protein ParE